MFSLASIKPDINGKPLSKVKKKQNTVTNIFEEQLDCWDQNIPAVFGLELFKKKKKREREREKEKKKKQSSDSNQVIILVIFRTCSA